ncbi:ParA family protein [Persicobacter psychrovividus]|uniref:AAA domain-containing protein n=1 Tax=Persicobacter psychrovividus TaxID=387638 RepID=A0ABN6LFD0_9BACT|nr:hypothetical protein PEPS_41480 [Persicobacter psychrovividus]
MTNDQIRTFFRNNPALNLKQIEIEAGIPNTYLNKAMKGRNLSEEHIKKVAPILIRYGFKDNEGAKVYAIYNHKGGVGKTTTSVNLAVGLANKNFKVLLIDFDPQANTTQHLGYRGEDRPTNTIRNVLTFDEANNLPIKSCIYQPYEDLDTFHLIPSELSLTKIARDLTLRQIPGMERLSKVLGMVKQDYDYILLDTPPNMDILVTNAMVAAHSVIIPVIPDSLPYEGLADVIDFVKDETTLRLNPDITVEGILLTMVKGNTALHQSIEEKIRSKFSRYKVFDTKIRNTIALSEASEAGEDIFSYSHRSNAAKDYKSFTEELING